MDGMRVGSRVVWSMATALLLIGCSDASGPSGNLPASVDDALWALPVDGIPGNPVQVASGTIYLPVGFLHNDDKGYLYAINPDGSQLWRTALDVLPSSTTPAIGPDGTIYVHGNGLEGNIVAVEKLQAITPGGAIAWTFEFNGGLGIFTSGVQSAPAVASDGTIYVGSMDTHVYALNPDGTIKWAQFRNNSIKSSPALAADGTVYIFVGNALEAYTPDGTLSWTYEGGNIFPGSYSPVIGSDGTVYVGHQDGYLYAISPLGELRWRTLLATEGRPISGNPAIGNDGTIYITGDAGAYALGSDGTIRWTTGGDRGPLFIGDSSAPAVTTSGRTFWAEPFYVKVVNADGFEERRIDGFGVHPPTQGPRPLLTPDGVLYVPDAAFDDLGQNALLAFRVK